MAAGRLNEAEAEVILKKDGILERFHNSGMLIGFEGRVLR
jgi:hypothetical protein